MITEKDIQKLLRIYYKKSADNPLCEEFPIIKVKTDGKMVVTVYIYVSSLDWLSIDEFHYDMVKHGLFLAFSRYEPIDNLKEIMDLINKSKEDVLKSKEALIRGNV